MVNNPPLKVSGLTFSVSSTNILNGVNIAPEDTLSRIGIVGANGAGKSTLFKCIMGFEKKYRGDVFLNDQNIASCNPHERVAKGLGYLAQESWLFLDMSCYENLLAPLQLSGKVSDDVKKKCLHFLEEYGLSQLKDRSAKHLSGGEKRRLEIARTMMLEPKVLLLDEPFAGLDPHACEDLKTLLSGISEKGTRLWISDHQINHIVELSEKIYLMDQGVIILSGSPEELQQNELAKKTYF